MNGGPRGGGGPLVAWSTIMVALGLMLAIWSAGDASALLFLVGPAALVPLAVFSRLRPAPGGPRLLARVSVPVVVTALGVALAAVGLTGGLWLVLIGAEVGVFGLVWLAIEIVSERRRLGR
ncbi:MAG TPA: hypothetical protein VMF55_13200 [Solirubrobacterales bacterium]|nr:hypothetical protein [Solirubrobacterales bacterium]